jgi:uncharacterized membrane protein YphA (DoxX/SURF4 family)
MTTRNRPAARAGKIIYWIATILLGFGMLQSGIFALLKTKEWIDLVTGLGYPVYFFDHTRYLENSWSYNYFNSTI